MTNSARLAAASLTLCLVLGGVLGSAQSSPGAQSAPDKNSSASSEQNGSNGSPVYRVGGGVTAPRAKFSPPPEYSKEARKAKYQGTCVLWLVVDTDGNPRNIKIARSLGKGLDEKAIEAVKKWKFDPATKDGQPVAVQINIEVTFRLY